MPPQRTKVPASPCPQSGRRSSSARPRSEPRADIASAPLAWSPPLEELLPDEPLDELEPEPCALSRRMLAGSSAAGAVGCVPISPLPTMTIVPLLGMPFTFTKSSAGPGWKRFGFGGACATCSVIEPSELTVYVLFSCR